MAQRKPIFMIHKHHATKLHYDIRLEIEGTLKSFATYELPLKPSKPIRATQVADHPFWYRHFEGVIPEGSYGAGPVMVWDKGLYRSFMRNHSGKRISLEESFHRGLMMLWFEGHKITGGYLFIRISTKQRWLIIKLEDEQVLKGRKPKNWNRSVKSDHTLEQIFKEGQAKAERVRMRQLKKLDEQF
jgi:DNA ligase D-like protein (predicted 3'-phosphoesterase)